MKRIACLAFLGLTLAGILSCSENAENPGDFNLKAELSMDPMLVTSTLGQSYVLEEEAVYDTAYTDTYDRRDTTFEVDAEPSIDTKGIAVKFTVENTGKRDGTEIVQVYIRNTADKEGPLKTLRAFKRVDVKAGQKVTDTIRLDRESFEGWDSETNTMRFVPGTYDIYVGNSSLCDDEPPMTITIQ